MKTGITVRTSGFALVALLAFGACAARAQEPPPPVPPATPPPVTQPPVAQPPATDIPATQSTPPATQQTPPVPTAPPPTGTPTVAPTAETVAPKIAFTDAELRRRRDAIYLLEGLLVNTVKLAARRTQSQIEQAVPELSVTLFSAAPPQANGIHLDDYGVVFNVTIPSYQDAVVSILNMMGRSDPAQPTASTRNQAAELPLNPTLIYVQTVRDSLVDAMLKYGQTLELRADEWLAIAARGEGGPGPVSEPSVLILRVRGNDLYDFLGGRLSRAEVEKRVQMKPFSGGR
jgi:hypothetical protein